MEERDLVLLDEPFSALDARTRAEMQELAHELLQHRTVLLVTHDPGEAARLGDKIYILNEQGLEQVEAKKQAQIALADGDETMRRQSFLLRQLRERVS
jgi:putative hydroxymethylpyrimidine transport system ATP-binding protein